MLMGTREVLGSAPLDMKVVFSSRDCNLASGQACREMNSVLSQPLVGHVYGAVILFAVLMCVHFTPYLTDL